MTNLTFAIEAAQVRENALNILPHGVLLVRLDGSNRNSPNTAAQSGIGNKFRAMRHARDLMELERLYAECVHNIQLLVSTGIYGRSFNYLCFKAVAKIHDQQMQKLVGWKFKDGRLKTREDYLRS